jgi:hypothetical protein
MVRQAESCAGPRLDRVLGSHPFNLPWSAVRHPSQRRFPDCGTVPMHGSTVMIKVLEGLLDKISRERQAKNPAPSAAPKRPNTAGDFRSVSVAPCLICCSAAVRAARTPYLSRQAPRLPLDGCTMPASCSCKFRKSVDRREGDRRLFGATETNRWFAGRDNRKRLSRRATEL